MQFALTVDFSGVGFWLFTSTLYCPGVSGRWLVELFVGAAPSEAWLGSEDIPSPVLHLHAAAGASQGNRRCVGLPSQ